MAERELIRYIRALAAQRRPHWLSVGMGDDAAVVRVPRGDRVVLTTDMLIEGVHYERGTRPEAVGRKAVARCLSDLAGMAAEPLCTLAATKFPTHMEAAWRRRLSRALWETSCELGAPLVGGDVAGGEGPLTVTVTAVGLPGPGGPVTRAGARPGDSVCVTGALGGSPGGRHLSFTPRLSEALELAERFDVHAMIDVSDGLSTDVLHIAEESRVGVRVEAEAIPVHSDVTTAREAHEDAESAVGHALNDGEDYELVFCVSVADAKQLAGTGLSGTPVSIIGEVTRARECVLVWPDGRHEPLRGRGWEHLET